MARYNAGHPAEVRCIACAIPQWVGNSGSSRIAHNSGPVLCNVQCNIQINIVGISAGYIKQHPIIVVIVIDRIKNKSESARSKTSEPVIKWIDVAVSAVGASGGNDRSAANGNIVLSECTGTANREGC